MTPAKLILIPFICGVASVIAPPAAFATQWPTMDVRYLVYHHADVIVSGRIVRVESKAGEGSVGIIEVSEMIYGPRSLKTVRLHLSPVSNGNSFKVGDEGIWFLCPWEEAVPRNDTAIPDPPRLGLDSKVVFEALHPFTFWRVNRDHPPVQSGHDRLITSGELEAKPERPTREADMIEMRQLVQKRLVADIAALTEALESAKAAKARGDAADAATTRPSRP